VNAKLNTTSIGNFCTTFEAL